MPTYKITAKGKTFKVTAPNQESALAALNMQEQDLTTTAEDIQGAGTKILDGLLLGFGDEAAAAMRAGIDVGVAGLFGEEASLYGGDFSRAYENIVANQRDVEKRFEEQNPKLALGLEVAAGLPTGMATGKAALMGASKAAAAAGKAGTTRMSKDRKSVV